MFEVREYAREYTGAWWADTGQYKVYPYLTEEEMYDALSAKHGVPTHVHRGSGFNIDHTRWTWGRAATGTEVIVGEFMVMVERHVKNDNGWTSGGRRAKRYESRTAMGKALIEDHNVPNHRIGDGYYANGTEVITWGEAGALPSVTRNSLLMPGHMLYVNGKPELVAFIVRRPFALYVGAGLRHIITLDPDGVSEYARVTGQLMHFIAGPCEKESRDGGTRALSVDEVTCVPCVTRLRRMDDVPDLDR